MCVEAACWVGWSHCTRFLVRCCLLGGMRQQAVRCGATIQAVVPACLTSPTSLFSFHLMVALLHPVSCFCISVHAHTLYEGARREQFLLPKYTYILYIECKLTTQTIILFNMWQLYSVKVFPVFTAFLKYGNYPTVLGTYNPWLTTVSVHVLWSVAL